MDIITKDQRVFRFKFSSAQQLESSYFAIMMSAQNNRHANLFAYTYLEGVLKQKGDHTTVCLQDIKLIVQKEYQRLGAYGQKKEFKIMQLTNKSKRARIGWHDFQAEIGGFNGLFVPADIAEDKIYNSAECRQEGRFPTLAYINQKSGHQIWRCAELRQKNMGTVQAEDDVALIEALQKQTGELAVYSARDQNIGTGSSASDRAYGYESR